MHLTLDHVTIAGPDLNQMRASFARVGLPTEYGGLHSNAITHMALLGFEDGSYLELISTEKPGTPAPLWPRQIAADGGPCAWCVRVEDINAECSRLSSLGVPVRGPSAMHRIRPDGTRIEWDLAFPGAHEPGAVLPFLIQDRTPREWRVRTSPSISGTVVTGIATVVIAVSDLAWNTTMFERVYGWTHRETHLDPTLDATVVSFTGTPLALATPRSGEGWLRQRLAQFGDSPALFLLRSRDRPAAEQRFPSAQRGTWLNRPSLWLSMRDQGNPLIGIIS